MPASILCRCTPGAVACPYVKLLNTQWFACANSGCLSAIQAWRLRGLQARGYFVSGCDDTWAYLWDLAGAANATDVCVCRHDRETASPVGYERHLSQFRKSLPLLFRGKMSGARSRGGRSGVEACRCVTTPGLIARARLLRSPQCHRRRAPGTSRALVL